MNQAKNQQNPTLSTFYCEKEFIIVTKWLIKVMCGLKTNKRQKGNCLNNRYIFLNHADFQYYIWKGNVRKVISYFKKLHSKIDFGTLLLVRE